MKKLLALMLMVCMMMLSTSAMAEAVLQDEQPPKLIAEMSENGEVYAVILGADGNAVAQVLDAGLVPMEDVHNRFDAADEAVKARLSAAYLGVMDNVHHGDVECKLHEHDVKVDVDTVLASMGLDIDAYDLVMYELFDVSFAAEVADKIAEGGSVELKLEANQKVGAPLIVLFTADGANWQVLPTAGADNAFTVRVPSAGTMALLCDGKQYMYIGEPTEHELEVDPGDRDTESDPSSIIFTPSVGGKPSPDLIPTQDENNEEVVGFICDDLGNVKIGIPNHNYVLITAVSGRDDVLDIQTHEHLEWGYDGILNAADVGALMSDSFDGTIADALNAALQSNGSGLTHDQLVVKDLFEVTAYGDYLPYLYNEDYYVELTFDAGLAPDETLVVIHSQDSEHWHIHDSANVIRNQNGTVTLKLYDLGAVAFLVEAEYSVDAEGAVQAP